MSGTAMISGCGRYRYRLTRTRVTDVRDLFAPAPTYGTARAVHWVMLNPSTADADVDDATIRKCMGYAQAWGYGRLLVSNLYAYRARDPSDLIRANDRFDDIIGPDNDTMIARADAEAEMTICAWGCHEAISPARVEAVGRLLSPSKVHCLHLTKYGAPGHPLYLSAGATPMSWRVQPEARPQPQRTRRT